MEINHATYQTTPSQNGKGTFYNPDCCKFWIYSVNDEMAYHGKLCPSCFWKGKHTTLYLRGTEEANRVMDERRVNYEDI